MGWHCFKKHVLPTNFYGDGKEEETNSSMVKKYGRHEISSILKFLLLFPCVLLFFLLVFPFLRGLSIISS